MRALRRRVACAASRLLSVLSDVLLAPSGFTPCDFWVPAKCLVAEQASASSGISPQVVRGGLTLTRTGLAQQGSAA
jgi:hypothetical protein